MKTAKTSIRVMRSGFVASCAALLALGAVGFAGAAQARDNILFSVGVGVPGVAVGVSNAYPVYNQPVYAQPVYSQPAYPQPVYVQQQPVYVQRQPVYVQPAPVYYQNAPVYYGRPHGHGHHRGGYYVQAPGPVYGSGFGAGFGPGYYGQRYAPVYYRR